MGFRGVGLRNVSIWGDLRGGHRSCQSALGGLFYWGFYRDCCENIPWQVVKYQKCRGHLFQKGIRVKGSGLNQGLKACPRETPKQVEGGRCKNRLLRVPSAFLLCADFKAPASENNIILGPKYNL